MAWGGDDDRDDVRDDDRDDAANDKSSHSPAFVSSSPRASRVASRVLRPAPAPQGFPGCAPSRWCFIRACRVARARTLRAFCRTMTTYLCTNPLATSARAVLSSSVAADDFAPSKVTASIAAARGAPLRAGHIITLGSVVKTIYPAPGDRIEAVFEGLAPVRLTIA